MEHVIHALCTGLVCRLSMMPVSCTGSAGIEKSVDKHIYNVESLALYIESWRFSWREISGFGEKPAKVTVLEWKRLENANTVK